MAATHSLQLLSASLQNAAKSTPVGLSDTGDMTIELWIRSNGSISRQTLVTYTQTIGVNTSQEHYRLDLETNGSLRWVQRNASNNVETPTSSTGIVINNVWQHIAVVRQTSDSKIYYYVNGELMGSTAYTLTPFFSNTATNFKISDSEAYNGLIRNVRIWGDVRTLNEIRDNMNVDTPNNTTDLLDQFILNNNYNSFSGNNTLTASGSPVFSTTYPDAIDLVENQTFTKKHKITVQHTQVAGSANLTDVPIVFTESNFLSDIFTNSQGSEINTNKLKTDANLQGYWRLEANGNDTTTNAYNLSATGTPTFGAGKFGNAATFVYGTSYYSIAKASAPNLYTTGSFTISGWCYATSFPSGYNYPFSSWKSADSSGWYVSLVSGTYIRFYLNTGAGVKTVDTNFIPQTNTLYHIAAVLDASLSKVFLYVNGQKFENTGHSSCTASTNPFYIAANSNNLTEGFTGWVDDVSYFNRALSQTEVEQIYKGGADLRFSSDIDGKTRLAHEIVSFDKGTSKAEVWVKANTLDFDDNTDIYVHYGNSTALALDTNEAFGRYQVWRESWVGVWHLNNNVDSSKNSYNLTEFNAPSYVAGKIGNAVDFGSSNTNKKLETTNTLGIDGGNITMLGWYKLNSEISSSAWNFIKQGNNTSDIGYNFSYEFNSGTRRLVFARNKYFVAVNSFTYNVTLGTSNWNHIILKYDGTNLQGYLNSTSIGTVSSSGNGSGNDYQGFVLGSGGTADFASIDTDAVLIYKGVLTDDYISTIYNNQNSPSTFAIPSSLAGGSFLFNFV